MSNLAWKLNRLRAMGVPEILHRCGTALRQQLQARGYGLAQCPPAPASQFGPQWLAPLVTTTLDPAPYVAAAESILAGHYDVLALRGVELGMPPQWNRDPKTGILAPLQFGKTINYRDESVVGDIKCLWEPNRHLALSDLAMAYRLSGDGRYLRGVALLLESWWQQCPYPLGVNWGSALELALRLVSWSITWQLIGGVASPLFVGADGQALLRRWLDSIYQHCHCLAGHFSRHSSANNHLFGELTGLYVAAVTWPCWQESAAWQRQAGTELEVEALRQNGPDGVNREQAIYYQHTVADEMLLVLLVSQATGQPRSPAFAARLESMLEFIAALMDAGGGLAMIGDADDAQLANWDKDPRADPYRSLLATGSVLFNRPDFKAKAGRFDAKSAWLLGDAGAAAYAAMPAAAAALPRAFPDGGYWVLGSDLDSCREVKVVADAGPLGYLGIAAHGHSDALAFTLSLGGSAVLVDPGTYAYHTHKQWRDYFRGTSAHNTVRVDGRDQSQSGGNFLWLRKAVARCEFWQEGVDSQRWCASHDGYLALSDPLLHRRSLHYDAASLSLTVDDQFECAGSHLLEWHWHLAPECVVRLDGATVEVRGAGFLLCISMHDGAATPQLVQGQEVPPLGWVSRRFDHKEAAPTIVWREQIVGGVQRRTKFHVQWLDA